MELDPAKHRLIYGFFERYLKLNDTEEESLMKEIKQMDDADKILEIPISYEERGIERGKAEEAKRVAKEMLKEGLPKELIAKVTHLDLKEIEKLGKKV